MAVSAARAGARKPAAATHAPALARKTERLIAGLLAQEGFEVLVGLRRLQFAAERLREKPFGQCRETLVVLGIGEAVTLVIEDDVRHGNVVFAHGADDLVTLALLHARIVRALCHQKRYANISSPKE